MGRQIWSTHPRRIYRASSDSAPLSFDPKQRSASSFHSISPFPAIYFTKSRTRQEYPHSLSYHESILIMWPPITFVYSASTIEELELPLKSDETSGSSENARMPFNSSLAASLSALFTSSLLVSFSTSMTTSTSETFGVGTRTL